MTLRRRILAYYAVTLSVSLVIVAFSSWFEFHEQREVVLKGGVVAAMKESPLIEALEIVLLAGFPAILIGIIGGSLLMGRALRPIEQLTEALEKTDISNLAQPVPRSGNGDELDRMTAVFNHMKERLGTSFTQAREFTLHASHELKTPLTILHGTLEQMMGDAATPPVQRERLTSMLEEVQRLSSIVGQLAFLAKADAGLLDATLREVPLHDLVRDLMEDLSHLASVRGISTALVSCQSVTVLSDRMRLRQLLLILGDNAVKHNHQDGSVSVTLSRQGEKAVFRIINTGHALSRDLRSRVFERFFRGDASHSSRVEGSGLGLSIAESIAKSHRGSLSYDVLSDGRTQLTLALPCQE
ncbi:MAG: HAMP domain-containing sensor histidine kinase [Verrucomicrobiota bacterium]